ncbi:ABC transporter permease [Gordonia alkaliphila]|nr:ABC transporter permease [Gordonia alkaliphila]MCK0439646.1 ABC transporter permease [Gordonia alkaliphila]
MNPTVTTIGLIAGREITTRVREKSFLISTAVLMVVIVAGTIVWSIFAGKESSETIGMVGGDPALSAVLEQTGEATGTTVRVKLLPDTAAAQQQVRDGDVDAAVLVADGPRYTLLSEKELGSTLDGVLRSGLAQYQLATSLAERGVDVADLTAPAIDTTYLEQVEADTEQRLSVALIGSMLLMMAIMTGGLMVAVGVVEEKTSRIVEILLSTVRPLHLLWGKILGIGVISLGQVVVLGATALIASTATGLLTVAGTAVSMFVAVIAWFLLGFLFFAALYAAVGAMVSRQEELNGAASPLTMLAILVLYSGIFGIQALDSTWIQVLSWIPPFSAILMPMRLAVGDASAMTMGLSFLVMIAVCAVVIWVSSRIYSRSVLRTGSRTSWSEVAGMVAGR